MLKDFVLFAWPCVLFFGFGVWGMEGEAALLGALGALGAVTEGDFKTHVIGLVFLQVLASAGGYYAGYKIYVHK
ncbi:MAG: hypothetical protein WCD20_18190, partial [Rhodomicrobium sp.]